MFRFHAPYDRFDPEQLIMRDYLAIQRTNLANERTFLSYIRSSIGLLILGVSFIKFLDSLAVEIAGGLFIFLSILLFGIGLHQYRKRRKQIPHISEMVKAERKIVMTGQD
ncbi:MAG: DUF202 domain-containing protein [Flavobacteriales bacterium]